MRTQGTGVGGAKRGARRPDLRERRVKTQSREETKKIQSANDPPSTVVVATRAIPFLRCTSRTFFSDSNNSDVNAIQPDGVRSPTTRSSADHPPPTSKTFVTPAVVERQTRRLLVHPPPFPITQKTLGRRATRCAARAPPSPLVIHPNTRARASVTSFAPRAAPCFTFFSSRSEPWSMIRSGPSSDSASVDVHADWGRRLRELERAEEDEKPSFARDGPHEPEFGAARELPPSSV